MSIDLDYFTEVWCVDYEYSAPPGERPDPVCLVAREYRSGRLLRLWQDDLRQRRTSPYPVDDRCLIVAYYASAEVGCHLALDWPVPARVLDLYTEFRNLCNGRPTRCGNGLLGALVQFGLDGIAANEKQEMRELAMRGGPYTADERAALLDYCQSDVDALVHMLPVMLPHLDLRRAVYRGRYMTAAARIEHAGVPIDLDRLQRLREHWSDVQVGLIERVDADYGVFEGRTFKADRWEAWLKGSEIPWPRLPSGRLALDDDTFRQMARAHPQVAPIRELRYSLGQLRLADLAVGRDGRNRCMLSAFRARTGRNQPSNSKFIFGPSAWLRGLIRPPQGHAVAYLDWSQQEFGVAAALSGDAKMLAAYNSGDPYLAFAKQAGAAPGDATKATHGAVRDLYKQVVLAVQYLMGEAALAQRIGRPVVEARQLLDRHRETYRTYWSWSDAALDHAMLRGHLDTVLGWRVWVGTNSNGRSLRNFPMQANGAEMLRLACCLATERGVEVAAPVHDALLIVAPLERLEAALTTTRQAMDEACDVILGGRLRLRTDTQVVRYPGRYMDPRGVRMWDTVWGIIDELEAAKVVASARHLVKDLSRQRDKDVAPAREGCRVHANPSTLISHLSCTSTSTGTPVVLG